MTRKSNRRHRSARLRFETLEDRSLLALAAFAVNLYEDAGGVPGERLEDDVVRVGETFFAEITAHELHPLAKGFGGIALDIAWDPHALSEISAPFDPRQIISPDLPVMITGTLDNSSGTITNLAGASLPFANLGRPIGDQGPERFALLHFQALSEVESSLLSVTQGRSSIVLSPTATLANSQIDFEAQFITVTAPQQPLEVASPALSTPTKSTPTVDTSLSDATFFIEQTVEVPQSVEIGVSDDAAMSQSVELGSLGQLNVRLSQIPPSTTDETLAHPHQPSSAASRLKSEEMGPHPEPVVRDRLLHVPNSLPHTNSEPTLVDRREARSERLREDRATWVASLNQPSATRLHRAADAVLAQFLATPMSQMSALEFEELLGTLACHISMVNVTSRV